jgi:hypothetical protein
MGFYYLKFNRLGFLGIYGLGDLCAQCLENYLTPNKNKYDIDYQRLFKQGLFGLIFGRYFYNIQLCTPVPLCFGTYNYLSNAIVSQVCSSAVFMWFYFFYWEFFQNKEIQEILIDENVYKKIVRGYFFSLIFFSPLFFNSYLHIWNEKHLHGVVRTILIFYTGMLSFIKHNNLTFKIEIKM